MRNLPDIRANLAQHTPLAPAHHRVIEVAAPLAPLLPQGGLVRGQVVGCEGDAASTLALALLARATKIGAWAALVGPPCWGLGAAAELGVALERIVAVSPPADDRAEQWGTVVAALIDGIDVVVLGSGRESTCWWDTLSGSGRQPSAGVARRLQAKLQARGGVLIVVGPPGPFAPDVTLRAAGETWEGIGNGYGYARCRRALVEVGGRRVNRITRHHLWLPGERGSLATAPPATTAPSQSPLERVG